MGATGTAGYRVTASSRGRGVARAENSRADGTDLIAGQGVPRAMESADVVVDVANTADAGSATRTRRPSACRASSLGPDVATWLESSTSDNAGNAATVGGTTH